jgi:hypothetical protein
MMKNSWKSKRKCGFAEGEKARLQECVLQSYFKVLQPYFIDTSQYFSRTSLILHSTSVVLHSTSVVLQVHKLSLFPPWGLLFINLSIGIKRTVITLHAENYSLSIYTEKNFRRLI